MLNEVSERQHYCTKLNAQCRQWLDFYYDPNTKCDGIQICTHTSVCLSVCLSVCTYIHTKVKKTPPTLKNDYYQTSTDGRPKSVFGQEANISLVSIYLIMAPDWFFTIHVYSDSGTSFAWNSSYTNKWIIIKLLQMVTLIRSCARSKAFDIGFYQIMPLIGFYYIHM